MLTKLAKHYDVSLNVVQMYPLPDSNIALPLPWPEPNLSTTSKSKLFIFNFWAFHNILISLEIKTINEKDMSSVTERRKHDVVKKRGKERQIEIEKRSNIDI